MEANVFEDCLVLVQEFAKTEKIDFDAFVNQWNELGFEHLWSAQTSYVEIIQTTAAALHVGKRLSCGRYANGQTICIDIERVLRDYRIGGIFLLYIIYFKQPTINYVKITVSLHTWQTIYNFIESLTDDRLSSKQARYMFYKLVKEHAFSFALLDYSVGIEGLVEYDKLDERTGRLNEKAKIFTHSRLRDELLSVRHTKEVLNPLKNLQDSYNSMKLELIKKEGANAHALPPTTIFTELNKVLQKVDELLDGPEAPSTSNSKGTSLSDAGKIRRSLKEKAFGMVDQGSNIGDPPETELDSAETEAPPEFQRRMSLKTIFNCPLPYEISKDLELPKDINSDDSDE